MPKMKILINILILLFVFFIFSFYIFLKSQDHNLNKIVFDSKTSLGKTYSLSPLFKINNLSYLDTATYYPYANIPPKNLKYFFNNITEKINLKNNKYDNLYYAEKRISELNNWGGEIPILNNSKNLQELKKWYHAHNFNNLNSWESIFVRYYLLCEQEINSLNQPTKESYSENLISLKGHFLKNQLDIQSVIIKLISNEENKKYLLNLSDNIFNSLNNKINEIIPQLNSRELNYSLQQIIKDKDFGSYQVLIDSLSLPTYLKTDIKIKLNQSEFNQNKITSNEGTVNFAQIIIDTQSNFLILKLKDFYIPIREGAWKKEHNASNNLYAYSLNLPLFEKKINYLLNFNYNFPDQKIIEIDKLSYGKNFKFLRQSIFSSKLYIGEVNRLRRLINFDKEENSFYQFILFSQNSLSQKDLNNLELYFEPIYEPDLTLEKIKPLTKSSIRYRKIKKNTYLIKVKNSTSGEDSILNNSLGLWWKIISKTSSQNGYQLVIEFLPFNSFIFIFLVYLMLINLPIFNFNNFLIRILEKPINMLKMIFILIISIIFISLKKFSRRFRLFSLISLLLIFFLDFFIINKSTVFFIFPVIFLWGIIIIGYRLEEKICFLIALFFLTVCPFLLSFNNLINGEKAAVWAFIFLNIGIIYNLVTLKLKINNLSNIQTVIYQIESDLKIIPSINKLSLNYSLPLHLLKQKIINLYSPYLLKQKLKKITKVELFKLFLFTFIISILLLSFITLKRYLHLRIERINLNPIILNISPELVYHSNIVVIRGYRFGWKQNEKVKLLSKYGEVDVGPDLWTDSHIVFPIPLHWKTEFIEFWVEKNINWNGKPITVKSNIVKIKLISRLNQWDQDDDKYFEQLKYLDKEILKLNGYK